MHDPIPWWNYVYVLESFFCPLNEMESVVIPSLLDFLILQPSIGLIAAMFNCE